MASNGLHECTLVDRGGGLRFQVVVLQSGFLIPSKININMSGLGALPVLCFHAPAGGAGSKPCRGIDISLLI